MHPTAIWAMRPYCVDARTLGFTKKERKRKKLAEKPGQKRREIRFPFRWIRKEFLAVEIGKTENQFFMSGKEKENRSLKNRSKKEGKLVFRFGG